MGTFNFTVTRGNVSRTGSPTLPATSIRTSGSHTSSTSASFVEDASGDITLAGGDILRATIDEAAWVNFGGDAAVAGTGFYMIANLNYEWECNTSGKVSVIDVA